ncbi:MAG: hypothetical protein IAA25_07845 [Candidatus Ruminococcus intestinipullorum]|nr:hypothetical protein [Candidatus Ruminococcus intestinipullorum]
MNESEIRRRELLRQTKALYSKDSTYFPIHSRYEQSGYNEEEGYDDSSFLFRLGICILCFVCFVWMDSQKVEVADVNSTQIIQEIKKQITPEDVPDELKKVGAYL